MGTPIPPEVRFERFVNRTEGCWLWTGVTGGTNAKYGYFHPGTRASDPKVMAHRYAYELWVGPIPEEMEIDHVAARGCISKLCVRPDHLEVVDHAENRKRGRLTLCRAGLHDLTIPRNVQWDKEGHRRGCAQCKRDKALARFYRLREAS